jgi:nicotinamide phosphoribosyltransferase
MNNKSYLPFNLPLEADSYKASHWPFYPPGMGNMYSYLESRGGKFPETVMIGQQYILKQYLVGQVFDRNDVFEAAEEWADHFGDNTVFNLKGWLELYEAHGGIIPIRIKAVPEGMAIPNKNVLLTVESTDEKSGWITNYIETLDQLLWYPMTVATLSRSVKLNMYKIMLETTDYTHEEILAKISFMLHDFGFRGASSRESAAIGGMAHLSNFKGTDTTPGWRLIKAFYNTNKMPGFSIPATEHSTITSWGKGQGEIDAYANVLNIRPNGLVACVSDSWDIANACENIWGGVLKDKILLRNGKLVIRPDSGDPNKTIEILLHILWEKFGGSVNPKGYRILDPHIGLIQGDGMDCDTIQDLHAVILKNKFSIENVGVGMGGGLLQKVNRDTQKIAFKCSEIEINGISRDVSKSPTEIQANGAQTLSFKQSKPGKHKLVQHADNTFETISSGDLRYDTAQDVLETVFENGKIVKEYTWDEVCENAQIRELALA